MISRIRGGHRELGHPCGQGPRLQVAHGLDDDQRVALAEGPYRLEDRSGIDRRGRLRQALDERLAVGTRQRGDLDREETLLAFELLQDRLQEWRDGELLGPDGGHETHGRGGGQAAQEERQEAQTHRVRPLEVVDDDEQRRLACQERERSGDGVEESARVLEFASEGSPRNRSPQTANGKTPSDSKQRPRRTRPPRRSACVAASSRIRVFPTPASPDRSASLPVPPQASSSAR